MIKQELVEYIHRQFQQGHDAATIKEHLMTHGYIPEIAEEAIKHAKKHKKQHKPMHIPFSAPSVAFLFVCIALFGMSMYWGVQSFFTEDLAGAVVEPVQDTMNVEESKNEETVREEEPSQEQVVQEEQAILEEEIIEEASTDEIILEENEQTAEIESTTRTSHQTCSASSCPSGVCYNEQCMDDNDKDGLADVQEEEIGTNRLDQDTDNDGLFDGEEVESGTDPLVFDEASVHYCSSAKDCAAGEGCSDMGICVVCADGDALNYETKGKTSGTHYTNNKALISTDNCSGEDLLEFYCREDGYLFYQEIDCAAEFGEGYYCSEGKCVR